MLNRIRRYFNKQDPLDEFMKLPDKEKLGDGKAVFFGEGTHEEFEEQEKEDKGLKGIFGL